MIFILLKDSENSIRWSSEPWIGNWRSSCTAFSENGEYELIKPFSACDVTLEFPCSMKEIRKTKIQTCNLILTYCETASQRNSKICNSLKKKNR